MRPSQVRIRKLNPCWKIWCIRPLHADLEMEDLADLNQYHSHLMSNHCIIFYIQSDYPRMHSSSQAPKGYVQVSFA